MTRPPDDGDETTVTQGQEGELRDSFFLLVLPRSFWRRRRHWSDGGCGDLIRSPRAIPATRLSDLTHMGGVEENDQTMPSQEGLGLTMCNILEKRAG